MFLTVGSVTENFWFTAIKLWCIKLSTYYSVSATSPPEIFQLYKNTVVKYFTRHRTLHVICQRRIIHWFNDRRLLQHCIRNLVITCISFGTWHYCERVRNISWPTMPSLTRQTTRIHLVAVVVRVTSWYTVFTKHKGPLKRMTIKAWLLVRQLPVSKYYNKMLKYEIVLCHGTSQIVQLDWCGSTHNNWQEMLSGRTALQTSLSGQ